MSDDPWFKFYPSDWRGGVSKLSAAERGVYISLIVAMYDHGGPIRRDDSRLARECGLPKVGFVRALDALIAEGKIEFDGQCLFNSRAKHELTEREKRSVSARTGAIVTNAKKRAKSNIDFRTSDARANAIGVAERSLEARHTRSQSPDIESPNGDSGQRLSEPPEKQKPKKARIKEILCEVLTPQSADDILDHRRAKGEPLTERAAQIAVEEIRKYGGDPELCVREWISRGWRGFKAEWMQNSVGRGGSPAKNGHQKPNNPTYGELLDALRNDDDHGADADYATHPADPRVINLASDPYVGVRADPRREGMANRGEPVEIVNGIATGLFSAPRRA